jgi:hypothetical protein
MAKATVKTSNFNKPAPRWYRVTKRIVYLLTSSGITTGTLTRFGIPESDQLLIMGLVNLFNGGYKRSVSERRRLC